MYYLPPRNTNLPPPPPKKKKKKKPPAYGSAFWSICFTYHMALGEGKQTRDD